jgi:hypothetical protein
LATMAINQGALSIATRLEQPRLVRYESSVRLKSHIKKADLQHLDQPTRSHPVDIGILSISVFDRPDRSLNYGRGSS